MTYTRSTCRGDSRKIDQHSTRSILRCGSVGMITCQCVNHFSQLELVTSLDYIDWFRHNDKSYLLQASERRQYCRRRPRLGPINPRSGEDAVAGSTFTPSAPEDLIAMQPPSQYGGFGIFHSGIEEYVQCTKAKVLATRNTLEPSRQGISFGTWQQLFENAKAKAKDQEKIESLKSQIQVLEKNIEDLDAKIHNAELTLKDLRKLEDQKSIETAERSTLFKEQQRQYATVAEENKAAFEGKAPLKVMSFSGICGKSSTKSHDL
ncbi:hypothetical protein J1N35_043361 [Gossypium stocksii]|uniref:Uncharacterized protein n=1 Tax=Gossypium stocksii TaxID=47602 RepID=A0A9D3U778_9ROSI|nr:hypothetical protein J1N35_043361 [Gossypium stocksii]